MDSAGNVFVADSGNNRIRKVAINGFVSTYAGSGEAGSTDGEGAVAKFKNPLDVAVDPLGRVYVADKGSFRIRIVALDKTVSTVSEPTASGVGLLINPNGIVLDASGNAFVAEFSRIKKVAADGTVSEVSGYYYAGYADGSKMFNFNLLGDVVVDSEGNAYVADTANNVIRKVSVGGMISQFAGSGTVGFADGDGASARFYSPSGLAVAFSGSVYVADRNNHRIRKIAPDGTVSTLAGSGTSGYADGDGATARFNKPARVAVDTGGNVYVTEASGHRIRKITPDGEVSTLAGSDTGGFADGMGAAAKFNLLRGLVVNPAGTLYVSDFGNQRIRSVTPAGLVSTFSGSGTKGLTDGASGSAEFTYPEALAMDSGGNLYVIDNDHYVRKVDPDGSVSTLAGNGTAGHADGLGTSAVFNFPAGISVDAARTIWVVDRGGFLRKLSIVP